MKIKSMEAYHKDRLVLIRVEHRGREYYHLCAQPFPNSANVFDWWEEGRASFKPYPGLDIYPHYKEG